MLSEKIGKKLIKWQWSIFIGLHIRLGIVSMHAATLIFLYMRKNRLIWKNYLNKIKVVSSLRNIGTTSNNAM